MTEEIEKRVPENEMVAVFVGWWQVYKLAGRRNVLDAETSFQDDDHASLHFNVRPAGRSAVFMVKLSRHKDGWYVDEVEVTVAGSGADTGAHVEKWLTLTKLGTFMARMRKEAKAA